MSRQLILQTLLQTLRKFPTWRTGTTFAKLKTKSIFQRSFVLVVLILILNFVSAQTYVSGIISIDTTWTLSGNPYIITGTTSVDTGITLTIESGVEVRFQSGMSIQVDGELVAIGTADSMVTFISDSDTVAGSWGFIKFTDSSVDATFDGSGNYTGGSILQYCKVFYGGGSGANGAIQLDSATPFIDHCEIKNNGQRGIYANNLSGVLKITNNTIIDNTNNGIYTSGDTVIISNNTINNNSANRGAGIYVSGGTVTISSNTISSNHTSGYQPNGGGIYVSNGTVTISDNIISNNRASGGYNHIYGGGVYISGGTVSVINNQIIDNYSDHYAGGIYISGSESSVLDSNLVQGNVSEGSGNSSGGGITVNGSVTVSNNTIVGNSGIQGGGIYTGNNYSGTISGNILMNNTANNGGAIFGTGSVVNNTITENLSSSSIIYYSGENISYNTIIDNEVSDGNTVYFASNALFNNNNIFNNASNYEIYNGTSNDMDATNNWWGTIEETTIQEMIYDWFDDASKGIVDYTPYLLSNDPNAPLMPPQNLTALSNNEQVTLRWNTNIESDLHKYNIYRSASSPAQMLIDSVVASSPPDTFYIDTTIISGQTYYYRITAVDSSGNESGFSNEVSAKTIVIPLNTGWNLISWDVDTENDSVVILLSDIMGSIVVVLGFEAGGLTYDPDLPQFSTLQVMDHLHGYWIKMVASDTLYVTGETVEDDTPITMEAGWNLVSYLPDNPDSVAHAFGSIIDQVIVVLGFNEGGLTYDPNWPQFSNLQILSPGFGYWIKMTDPGTLVYPDVQVAAGRLLAKVQDHISSGRSILYTSEWVSVLGNGVIFNSKLLKVGTVIQAKDPDGVVCGQYIVEREGCFGMMPVYRDDPKTDMDEGAEPGDEIRIYFNSVEVNERFTWGGFGEVYRIGINPIQPALPATFALSQNYPNPFNPVTRILYQLPEANHITITVFNIRGQYVKTVINGWKKPGYHSVIWNGKDEYGKEVSSGMYFYRMTAGEYLNTKKMIILR